MRARLAAWAPSCAARAAIAASEPAGGFVDVGPMRAQGSHGVRVGSSPSLRVALDELCPPAADGSARTPLFFDLETCGLSVDAPPFLIGLLGFASDGTPWLRQLRLDVRAGEGAMWRTLHGILHELAPHSRLVTYNGASFDRTLSRVRLRRLGLYDDRIAALFDEHHVDLLPVCRRLWRAAVPDHRLVTLERHVLRAARRDDPHGSDIAELGAAWLDGARDADSVRRMDAVLRHNADDLCGLAALVTRCARVLREPTDAAQALGVAIHLHRTRRTADALALLRSWAARAPVRASSPITIDVAAMLAMLERRHGDRDRAHAAWQSVQRAVPGHRDAALALAKDFEHRLRLPAAALAVLETMLDPCAHRAARLRAKLPPDEPTPRDPPRPIVIPVPVATPAAVVVPIAPPTMPGTWRSAPRARPMTQRRPV